jgi:hypothetical protein
MKKTLKDLSSHTITELREHINAFSARYNETAEPFVWTKCEVHQKRIKGRRFCDLWYWVVAPAGHRARIAIPQPCLV